MTEVRPRLSPEDRRRQRPARWASVLGLMAALLCAGCALVDWIFFSMTPRVPTPSINVGVQLVADGLVSPVGLAAPPDGSGRLFILDQIGAVRIIDADGTLRPAPFLDVADRMVPLAVDGTFSYDERGLLGLAFHPDYANNGQFFVFYTASKGADQPADFDSESHISEFHVSADPNIGDPASEQILLRIGKPQSNHNGGQLAFGPDGFLYISTGDGGGANDTGDGHNPAIGNGQDKTTLLAKILRIDVDNGSPYGIPPENQFFADPTVRPEIYALGTRNAWRFSFDSGGTHRLFVGDVGQDLYEEVNIVGKGDNLGWRVREADACFDPSNPSSPPAVCANSAQDGAPLVPPILQYPHSNPTGGLSGLAVIGGFVYRGAVLPNLAGRYIFGDWSKSFVSPDCSVFMATEGDDGRWAMEELGISNRPGGRLGEYLRSMGEDASGELYLLTSNNLGPTGQSGRVYRIVP